MATIIPAIIGTDFEEVRNNISKVANYVDWVQIDVVDGVFASPESWPYLENRFVLNVDKLVLLKQEFPNIKIELHLMVNKPEETLDKWLQAKPDRIYVHIESTSECQSVLERIRNNGISSGIAINYLTGTEKIDNCEGLFDFVQIMTIESIGSYGKPFVDDALKKIKDVKMKYPDIMVSVDGGINIDSGKKAVDAGADILVVGSAIMKSNDISRVIESFKKI